MSEAAVKVGVLAQLELGSVLGELPGIKIQSAKTPSGAHITAAILAPDATTDQATTFARIAKLGGLGGLKVQHAEEQLIIATPSAAGTLAHLPSLGWKLQQRLEVFWKILEYVNTYHQQGFAVGPLDPQHVMLDDDLQPFLLGPRVAPPMGPFAAPESISSARVDITSDVYSLGKLLHFIVAQDIPADAFEDPARLEELMTFPAGLSRIIRKATLRTAAARYGSVRALADDLAKYGRYEEVGLPHADVTEQNFGGTSQRPPAVFANKPAKKSAKEDDAPIAARGTLKKIDPLRLKPAVRLALLGLGLMVILATIGVAYVVGDATWVHIVMSLGAAVLGLSLFSPGIDKESTLRTIFGVFFGTAMFMGNPAPYLAKSAEQAGLRSADVKTRIENFRSLKQRGQFRFTGLDLSGADLPGEQFYFVVLETVSLTDANLESAEFLNVQFSGVDVAGANLAGAHFVGSDAAGLVNLEKARCNAESRMPAGWLCEGSVPKKDPSYTPPKPGEDAGNPFGAPAAANPPGATP